MRREEKYKDTECFIYYNANPHNRKRSDCVVRAIATALGQSWETTVKELTEISLKTGYVLNDEKCYSRYLEAKGFVQGRQPKLVDLCTNRVRKLSGKEWLSNYACNSLNYVIHIGTHHVVAVIDGKVRDIWDCTDNTVGKYWYIKKGD